MLLTLIAMQVHDFNPLSKPRYLEKCPVAQRDTIASRVKHLWPLASSKRPLKLSFFITFLCCKQSRELIVVAHASVHVNLTSRDGAFVDRHVHSLKYKTPRFV